MRRALALGTALLALASPTHAEECGCSPRRPLDERVEVKLVTQAARYDVPFADGNYQGITAQGVFTHDRYGLNVAVPWYHLLRNGEVSYGLGDLTLGASATILRAEKWPLGLSASFGAMAPTGDADLNLGMGHWMIMPGLLAWRDLGRFTPQATVQYSRALQGSEGHHHGGVPGTFPIVDPQNASELRLGLASDVRITGALSAHLGVLAALPVADENGVERYVASGGLSFTNGRTRFGLELQQPFASDPFDVKAVVSAAVRM